MTRLTLLATAAAALLAAPAFAAGSSHDLTGLVDLGYDYRNADTSPGSIDINAFHGTGAGLWDLHGNWNVQGEFGFNSSRALGGAIDTWDITGIAFWRDPGEGLIGGELSYQSIDGGVGTVIDGIGIGARGEYYLAPDITLGGRIRYTNLDVPSGNGDVWSFGATGRYYLQPNLGLNLGFNYSDFNGSANPWLIRGEAEYLFHDCDTSLYAGLEFGDADALAQSYWGLGIGLRLRLGTSGSLVQRDRTGPLQDINTARIPF